VKDPKDALLPAITGRKPLLHALCEWTNVIARHLECLSQTQARVLAMWSLGMVLAQACGLKTVTLYMAGALGKKEDNVRQQLREFYFEGGENADCEFAPSPVSPSPVPLQAGSSPFISRTTRCTSS
jgi:hypothetical protein